MAAPPCDPPCPKLRRVTSARPPYSLRGRTGVLCPATAARAISARLADRARRPVLRTVPKNPRRHPKKSLTTRAAPVAPAAWTGDQATEPGAALEVALGLGSGLATAEP